MGHSPHLPPGPTPAQPAYRPKGSMLNATDDCLAHTTPSIFASVVASNSSFGVEVELLRIRKQLAEEQIAHQVCLASSHPILSLTIRPHRRRCDS